MVKITLKEKYYKKSKLNREPIKYHAEQPGGLGTKVTAVVHMDPVLKQYPDIRKAMLQHERREISDWSIGKTSAHKRAKAKEPRVIKDIGGVSGFWKEVRRREKKMAKKKKVFKRYKTGTKKGGQKYSRGRPGQLKKEKSFHTAYNQNKKLSVLGCP